MRSARSWVALGTAGVAISATTVAMAIPSATAAGSSQRTHLRGAMAPASARSNPRGSVAATSKVRFQLLLKLRNANGAHTFLRTVSTPGSKNFHHYLTDAQWVNRYGPTTASVKAARSWLNKQGFTVHGVTRDRLLVSATGTARQVERAFGTSLGKYEVNGHTVRLASSSLSIPVSIAGAVSGVTGVNQYVATTSLARIAHPSTAKAKPSDAEPAPPAGFRNPQPCSAYWGQKTDTTDSSSLYSPYTGNKYDICGYVPTQLRQAYQVQKQVNNGVTGKGVGIAIVDAYDSPTLFQDAHHYSKLNDPYHVLKASQFTNNSPGSVDDADLCDGSGWYAEQALDVESSHGMAPGAHIGFWGAQDCLDSSLLVTLTNAVTSGASVVSNSYGDVAGDLLVDQNEKTAWDDTFMLAGSTGVSVLFSSGDDGDNFADFGLQSPDYPASSPYITAVGGTTLEINQNGGRTAEWGWSTAKQTLCAGVPTTDCGGATTPAGSLAWQAGGGGGTSYTYLQPSYQANVVPTALSERNSALFGTTPTRVEPDISMDGDAQSGMLIGLTQTFPDGVYYDQFKEGGTSLASPLLAGVIADTDQVAGTPLGFINPAIYQAAGSNPGAIRDTLAPTNPNAASVIRVDYANTTDATNGYNVSLRAIGYAGPETYCDGTGNCATRPVTLTAATGFDSLTGLGSPGGSFIQELAKY
jgi:subtilase family serine protease